MTAGCRYTLVELAAAAGMTARNVRAYQTRGLLSAPQRVGRRSVYTQDHLDRLLAIHRVRHGGATLTLIANHLADGGRLEDRLPSDSWLPRQREAGDSESVPASAHTDVTALLQREAPEGPPPQLQILLDGGVLTREGRRLLAGRPLAAGLAALHQRGASMPAVLDVVVAVTHLAEPVARSAAVALAGAAERTPDLVEDLADLAGTLIRELVRQRVGRDPVDS